MRPGQRWGWLIACLMLAGCSLTSPASKPAPPESPYLIVSGDSLVYHGRAVTLRGENFNNGPAMTCCGVPEITRINANADDYDKLSATLGGNYVRFGLEYQWYKKDAATFFQILDQHVQLAKRNHLWMIPVMFDPPGGSSGNYGGQEGFWSSPNNQRALTSFWVDFARHYAGDLTIAGYDLFNEPAPPSVKAWRNWAQVTTDAIAGVDSNHFVVLENDSVDYDVPAVHGPRIVWSSHCYARVGTNGCNSPGGNPSAPTKLPFLIGEVGTKPPTGDTAYVPDDINTFNLMGVSWTHFVMRESSDGFGLYGSPRAGDFTQPWTAMIDAVRSGMKDSVQPRSTRP